MNLYKLVLSYLPIRIQVPDLTECSYFPKLILGFNDAMLLVVNNVPINSEAPVMTSSISRFAGPTRFFGDAHRDRVCVCAFIEMSARSCI